MYLLSIFLRHTNNNLQTPVPYMKYIGNIIKLFIAFSLILFDLSGIKAAHIVGGEIGYECLGNENYRFTMKIYKEGWGPPIPGQMIADFDMPAFVTIYRGNETSIFEHINVPLQSRNPIEVNISNPCLEPDVDDIEVEEAIYSFDVNLPFHPQGYTISYQRCCRNASIGNIFSPADVGATYTIELTEAAQTQNSDGTCGNSSPVFNNFPPVAICSNEPINFDHSATDADGDQLEYEFYLPYDGASPAQPQPGDAPPPPYGTINFINPTYTFNTPLGNNPANPVNIDPNTGFLSGVPLTVGQFVVGIAVREYRNGQLLSITRRDFQFNVVDCQASVIADIVEDEIIIEANGEFFFNRLCGDSVYTIVDDSYESVPGVIQDWYWAFVIDGDTVESTDQNPTFTFPNYDTYEGILIINRGLPSCTDTANLSVGVYPDITSDFTIGMDTCATAPISFFDQAWSGSDTIIQWVWDYGDGIIDTFDTSMDPIHQYENSGNYNAALTVTDINNCEETYSLPVSYFPTPTLEAYVEGGDGCVPQSVTIRNLSFPNVGYQMVWDYGNGVTEERNDSIFSYTYNTPGVFDVYLNIISPSGCNIDGPVGEVTALENPVAGFDYLPRELSNLNPTVVFRDLSQSAFFYEWDFGNGDVSSFPEPIYTYPDTGTYVVRQVVTHFNGCTDTAIQVLDVVPVFTYFLPNAFTPNFDGVNDLFGGIGEFYAINEFEFTIWNRWGERIFETNDPHEMWNGRKHNTGDYVQNGVYMCLVKIRGARGETLELKSYATVVR